MLLSRLYPYYFGKLFLNNFKDKYMTFLKFYLFAMLAFFPLDMIWLGWLARGFYKKHMGHWMAEQTDWVTAAIFYLLFLSGLVYFVVLPSMDGTSMDVLLRGAFFGLITYGTYELTNRAVMANWPYTLVIVDILWGVVLCATVSWISWYFGR